METVILIIGANGQLGSVLTKALREKYGKESIIASDLKPQISFQEDFLEGNIFEVIDATNRDRIEEIVMRYRVTQIYHLAAILSATGEETPLKTWDVNLKTLLNVLEVSRTNEIDKVFFPSSIAVFGESAPQYLTPNNACLNPSTVYGISKVAGENWAEYYFNRYGLDVRSIRFPGVIGYQSKPGGGTTDYAVEIYHDAVQENKFTCFLKENTKLPMIYMDDAIRAALELMDTPKQQIKTRTSYNLSGISFSPLEIVSAIKKHYPFFEIEFEPDFRQEIADKWPNTIDDSNARNEWNWRPKFDLETMTKVMIDNLKQEYLIRLQ